MIMSLFQEQETGTSWKLLAWENERFKFIWNFQGWDGFCVLQAWFHPPPPAFPTGKQSSLHLWIARQYTEGIAVKPAFLLLSYHIDPAETRWRHLSLDIWLFKVLITLDTSLYSTACSALYHYLSYYFTHKTESIGAAPAAKFSCWTN